MDRGKHWARSKKFLNGLQTRTVEWDVAGFGIVVVSADTVSEAEQGVVEFG
ncbi:hypothetical protein [Tateyamaria sp.]|uniref:hypothetical protein n=1 Tax=Tateyamaria sp. TaxID=1929288 RepID=UPI00329F2F4F